MVLRTPRSRMAACPLGPTYQGGNAGPAAASGGINLLTLWKRTWPPRTRVSVCVSHVNALVVGHSPSD